MKGDAMLRRLLAIGVLAWLMWPGAAAALSCSVVMGAIDFGQVDVNIPGGVMVTGPVQIDCKQVVTDNVLACVSFGNPNGSSVDSRSFPIATGGDLYYNIYQDESRGLVWGSVNMPPSEPAAISLVANGGRASGIIPYFAYIPTPQPTVPSGNYSLLYTSTNAQILAIGYASTPPECSGSNATGSYFGFNVGVTVASACTAEAPDINFGELSQITSPITVSGNIGVKCADSLPYTVTLNAGNGAGATGASRRMTREGGSETLEYGLYIDPGLSTPWGDGSGGTATVSDVGRGSFQLIPIYGSLPVQTLGPVGTYRDTIIVTIIY